MTEVSDAGEPAYDEQLRYLADWSVLFRCQLVLDGEVGIGRECVGMLRGNSYLDYSHLWDQERRPEFWTPPNAYHKHGCMAVLGRGPTAVRELYDWARWLEANGWTTDDIARPPNDVVDLIFHGLSTPRLVKMTAAGDQRPTMRFFGTPWDAPATEGRTFEPPPAGADCGYGCGHAITAGDSGLILPYLDGSTVQPQAWHRDCFLTSIGVPPALLPKEQ